MAIKQETIIKVLQALGFKKYQAGKEIYFLPVAGKIKPMTKIKYKNIEALFGVDEPKDKKVKKVKKTKKTEKTNEVKE